MRDIEVELDYLADTSTLNTSTPVEAQTSVDIDVSVENVFEVEAQVNEWMLVNDHIYIVHEFGEIPPWLKTAIESIIESPDGLLVSSLQEIEDTLENFENGYNARVISLENSDETQNTQLTSLVSRSDDNAAGIVEIKDTYATEDYARAVSTEVVGAYLNDSALGGAWFEGSVSAVASVAYSAARSASSLNASMKSQASQIGNIWGSIDDLQKQADGVVETWFDVQDVVSATGDIILTAEPYISWVTDNAREIHTGDTYVKYELDVNLNKVYIASWRFTKTSIDTPYTDDNGFAFVAITDSRAEEAYQLALLAQDTADGKVNTWFQSWAPTLTDAGLPVDEAYKMNGDIWYDSSNSNNTMRRYDGLNPNGSDNPTWSANNWKEVSDSRIEASVNRLDEATVDIGGEAIALLCLMDMELSLLLEYLQIILR